MSAQKCKACGESFASTSAGDAHSVIADTYDLIAEGTKPRRVKLPRDDKGRPLAAKGVRVLSLANQVRRCLTVTEMAERGMETDRSGRWKSGGTGAEWWKSNNPEAEAQQ